MLGLPIALGLLYPFFGILLSLLLAAVAMSFSSVTAITNANRCYRPDVIVVQRGKPVRLNFVRQESVTCSEMVLLPAFDKSAKSAWTKVQWEARGVGASVVSWGKSVGPRSRAPVRRME